jgi:hypothetical protein
MLARLEGRIDDGHSIPGGAHAAGAHWVIQCAAVLAHVRAEVLVGLGIRLFGDAFGVQLGMQDVLERCLRRDATTELETVDQTLYI